MKPGTSPPPHDGAAEASVLGAVLLGGGPVFEVVRDSVAGEDFYETRHQLLWQLLARLHGEGSPLDAVLIRDAMGSNGVSDRIGGEAYLARLVRAVPSAANAADYAAIVRRHSTARKVIASCAHIAGIAYDPAALAELPARVAEEISYLREVLADVGATRVDVDAVAPRAIDLLAETDSPKAWVIDALLEEDCRMLLCGPSYVGKSLAATMASICVARGYGVVLNHGVEAPPSSVVIFYGEGSRRQVKNMVRTLLAGEPCPETLRLVEVHAQEPVPDLASAAGRAWYETILAQLRPRLVVLDTSTSLVFGDRNKAEVAQSVMNWLSAMGRKHRTAFIVVHHTRKASQKGDEGSPADKAYGGQEWTALADTAVLLEREKDGIRVHAWKVKDEAGDQPYLGRIDPDTLRIEFVSTLGSSRQKNRTEPGDAVKNLARKLHECREWMTAKDLAGILDLRSVRPVQRNLGSNQFTKWVEAGFFETEKPADPCNPTRYRSTGALPPELLA